MCNTTIKARADKEKLGAGAENPLPKDGFAYLL
jgi:hypothetical protein